MRLVLSLVIVCSYFLSADAHGLLIYPAARTSANNLITSPCGSVPSIAPSYVGNPGVTLPVTWSVTESHGAGTCSLNFASTDAGFSSTSSSTVLASFQCGANVAQGTTNVVLPSPAQIGVLQWQYPTPAGSDGGDVYYSCADILIGTIPSSSSSTGGTNGANSGNNGSYSALLAGTHNPGSFTIAASVIGLGVVFGFFGILYFKSRGEGDAKPLE